MGDRHIPIIDEDKLDDIITAIQALSAPSGTDVAISPTGMHIVTEDDVQGAISELDAKAYEINSSLTQLEQRETSETNPITQTIKPYGTFAPVSGGSNAVAFKFAIQNKVLFIQCFDENGSIITTLRANLT